MFTNANPKNAFEMNHSQAIKLLTKHGQQFGGGFATHTDAYVEYVVENQIPAEDV
ncbi:hypothetical protein [Apilactobacillus ozensis]|nr:hypothetical protein [Apilactobacillus ozensis]